ncbi:WD40-repeat-containing domain protein [Multifurca ochricompacta]|uniref:WD40-repeat-containing domain protein n=1 Tax=Multifurca ochricompacta TaxID=376703 RepID=A0AAD4M9V5_9AGAM|nr:WD40-repeat-containing domain protein [Multifurca ochricompacta]
MVSCPPTHLFHGEHKTIAISGPHIQILDSNSGELLHSTVSFESSKLEAVLKSGPVRCVAVNYNFTHLATAGDDKQLKVWAIDGLQLLSERELPKKPTQIEFTRSGQTIIVADKFGDVFSYPLTPLKTATPPPAPSREADTLTSHESPSGGTLILGHTSLLTAFLLTSDETHIITADRDEHIRVSWFPQGYVIESFCLGHKKFVSALHIPRDPIAHDILVSGGGDPVLKVWDWRAGRRLYDVAIEQSVYPFFAVRRAQRKRGYDSDGEPKPPSRRWLARQRRREAKAATVTVTTPAEKETGATPEADPEVETEENVEAEGDDGDEDENGDENGASGNDDDVVEVNAMRVTTSGEPSELPTPVLVVQKIETLNIGGKLVLVFSAIGATALFWFALPPDAAAISEELLVIHAHDFGRPVITFAPVTGSLDCVWVSVDAHWADEGLSPDVPSHMRLVQLTLGSATEVSPPPPLLSTLNNASVILANEREISTLQLYEPLTSLPKNIDATHNPMIRDAPDSNTTNAKGKRSAKAAGKLRTRMALQERGVPEEPPIRRLKEQEK